MSLQSSIWFTGAISENRALFSEPFWPFSSRCRRFRSSRSSLTHLWPFWPSPSPSVCTRTSCKPFRRPSSDIPSSTVESYYFNCNVAWAVYVFEITILDTKCDIEIPLVQIDLLFCNRYCCQTTVFIDRVAIFSNAGSSWIRTSLSLRRKSMKWLMWLLLVWMLR